MSYGLPFSYTPKTLIRAGNVEMTMVSRIVGALSLLLLAAPLAHADDGLMADRVLGQASAPVTVDEYVSLTCSHCAQFYNTTLPDLEKKYVETGKVKFILHDFPLDNIALKASMLARCLPTEQYYPFVKMLYTNQAAWAFVKDPVPALIQYAKMTGMTDEKAQACLKDEKLMNAIV
ncbi:MAG TPA: thioredoxin domain-containing protein, partial [Alphaproteobacteria bacterium]|nr:thioredoxin domain-containing protein [Alphaproteobacteria bacterium]